jgi:hypothetical protein
MESRRGTRRGIIILAVAVVTAAVAGCGQPGADGDAYIAYSWAVGPITIATNDPAFAGASYIYNGEFRQTSPGVYDFEYTAWDDSYWWGWYEIYVNPGEDGGAFGAGDDGADLYFEVLCLSTGASFYVWEDLASAALGTEGTEPLAVLGAGVPEAADVAEAADTGPGVKPAAEGDASEPRGTLGELGGPRPAGVETAAKTAGRPAAVVETVELPGYTVVFGFGRGAE